VRLEHPHRKGPNIARLAELNRGLGAEALLLDADGRALEGATTSLIWWRDDADQSGGAVDEPSTGGGRVASVTEELLHRTARGRLAAGRPTPAELTRCEVWAVNALHGIRVVTSIDGVALPESHGPRLERFREALDRTWAPLPTA
ncbi:aminotransferase class IV, partial [Leucobacter sp.]